MTEKLYYQDSHLFTFEAAVLDCRKEKKGYSVALDRTAFFPEGGGQLADTGVLGGVRVLDVHERGGEIRHYIDAPLEIGAHVEGFVDRVQARDISFKNCRFDGVTEQEVCKVMSTENVKFKNVFVNGKPWK